MVLKHFNLPEMHFKANLFFPIMTPLTHSTSQPRDSQGGVSKRGEWGLIKVKKQVDFKIQGSTAIKMFSISKAEHFNPPPSWSF